MNRLSLDRINLSDAFFTKLDRASDYLLHPNLPSRNKKESAAAWASTFILGLTTVGTAHLASWGWQKWRQSRITINLSAEPSSGFEKEFSSTYSGIVNYLKASPQMKREPTLKAELEDKYKDLASRLNAFNPPLTDAEKFEVLFYCHMNQEGSGIFNNIFAKRNEKISLVIDSVELTLNIVETLILCQESTFFNLLLGTNAFSESASSHIQLHAVSSGDELITQENVQRLMNLITNKEPLTLEDLPLFNALADFFGLSSFNQNLLSLLASFFEEIAFDALSKEMVESLQHLATSNSEIKMLWDSYLQKQISSAKNSEEAAKIFAIAKEVDSLQLPTHADDSWLVALAANTPSNLISLNLANCKKITDLTSLARFKTLQSLNLEECRKIDDAGLEAIKEFKELKHLNLYRCLEITEASIPLISQLDKLESLNLTDLCFAQESSLTFISYLTNLKNLVLPSGVYTHLAFLSPLIQLESLGITGCPYLTDYNALSHFTQLKKLVVFNHSIHDTMLLQNISKLPGLEELILGSIVTVESLSNEELLCLSNLKHLKTLKLYLALNNQDLGLFANLTSLENLALSRKALTGLQHLPPLRNLKTLSLSGCDALTDEGFSNIQAFPSLETVICVESHQLTDQSLNSLATLPNLRELSLIRCEGFTNEGFKKLSLMTKLEKLELNSTKIEDLAPLKELTSLHYLDLESCNMKTIDPLQHLPLTYLNLSTCWSLKRGGLSGLKSLTELQTLSLSRDRIVDASALAHLTNMKKLVNLNLADCDLSNSDLKHLASVISLEHLMLEYNERLSDKGIAYLKNLTKLRSIRLRSCPKITQLGFEEATHSMYALTSYEVDYTTPKFEVTATRD